MDTWTNQMGFPLITIIRDENEIIATQDRFLLTTESVNSSARLMPKSKYDYKWFVPLTYFTDKDQENIVNIWMNMSDGNTVLVRPALILILAISQFDSKLILT